MSDSQPPQNNEVNDNRGVITPPTNNNGSGPALALGTDQSKALESTPSNFTIDMPSIPKESLSNLGPAASQSHTSMSPASIQTGGNCMLRRGGRRSVKKHGRKTQKRRVRKSHKKHGRKSHRKHR